jgi:hypothetical protein
MAARRSIIIGAGDKSEGKAPSTWETMSKRSVGEVMSPVGGERRSNTLGISSPWPTLCCWWVDCTEAVARDEDESEERRGEERSQEEEEEEAMGQVNRNAHAL